MTTVCPPTATQRLMKSLDGSSGHWNTITSPRRGGGGPGGRRGQAGQPQVRERHLRTVLELVDEQEVAHEQRVAHRLGRDPERLDDERAQEQRDDHRPQDGFDVVTRVRAWGERRRHGSPWARRSAAVHAEDGEKRLLGHLDGSDLLHTPLAFLLFLQQLALARDVTTVTFRDHVLPQRAHGFAGDDLALDG